ncbi:LOW QUALITY PROTEIN: hypothetical protein OSB04_015372 [Centaurea solstitialis]|uniref:Uncharacterized protein n=1 Tax=Centaurea solstitialis TaxID=347529 RepID=A0AA38W8V8_9ASTR|nr:LOW QUALITY PROTEIN: hypothetical protein OSB04_015372 [Centaurea solstitialis]
MALDFAQQKSISHQAALDFASNITRFCQLKEVWTMLVRVHNKRDVVRTFLEACIHEIVIHGREGTNLKPSSWKNVAETLKNKHNFIIKNKWKTIMIT